MKEKLTSDETKLLMEYMLAGFVQVTRHIGEIPFVLQSLSVNQQMEAQTMLNDFKGNQLQWAQKLRLSLLSFGLESFGEKEFKTHEESSEFVGKAGDLLINKLTEAQAQFQEQIKDLLDRADDFTESPSSSPDSTLSSTVPSTSE